MPQEQLTQELLQRQVRKLGEAFHRSLMLRCHECLDQSTQMREGMARHLVRTRGSRAHWAQLLSSVSERTLCSMDPPARVKNR